jgi:hypothetical protein
MHTEPNINKIINKILATCLLDNLLNVSSIKCTGMNYNETAIILIEFKLNVFC